jgi:hypothetical protein
MGKCRYCGAEAGFLRGRHRACEADHRAAVAEITQCCWTAVTGSYDPALAREWVEARAPEGWISDPRPFFLKAWGDAVRKILDEGVLGLAEQERLNLVREAFDLAPAELGEAWLLRCQGIAIREVLEGRVPAPGQDFHVPFGVQQAERIVWAWSAVKHYRERTRPTFPEARPEKSPGVAGGVYHTLRDARAEAAAPTDQTLVGVGTLVFTDQNLYWGSAGWKAVRIPWKKVAAVRPFADGIGITKEGDPAMPMVFVIGETQGWLAWNLAENLPNLG